MDVKKSSSIPIEAKGLKFRIKKRYTTVEKMVDVPVGLLQEPKRSVDIQQDLNAATVSGRCLCKFSIMPLCQNRARF